MNVSYQVINAQIKVKIVAITCTKTLFLVRSFNNYYFKVISRGVTTPNPNPNPTHIAHKKNQFKVENVIVKLINIQVFVTAKGDNPNRDMMSLNFNAVPCTRFLSWTFKC
jgi:hypothetical protein